MERSHDLAAELASTLEWWVEAGVDGLVQEDARRWLEAPAQPISLVPSEVEGRGMGVAEGAPRLRSGRTETIVRGEESLPDQLDLFHAWLRTAPTLPYATPTASRVCPAGDPTAGLMILTAMPSTEDCTTNVLLSGAPGRLFDRMLAAIGVSRETVYLAGLSCLRPPGGRLDRDGAERCAAIARHHVGLAAPKAVLLLGDACAKALLGIGAAQARGRVHRLETQAGAVDAIATLTPDYLLAQPAAKALAWADLQLLMERL